MGYTDQQLKEAVDVLFAQYDKDGNGTLDTSEVADLINSVLTNWKANRPASLQ